MVAFLQTEFSKQISWMEKFELRLKFRGNLSPWVQLTTGHPWFELFSIKFSYFIEAYMRQSASLSYICFRHWWTMRCGESGFISWNWVDCNMTSSRDNWRIYVLGEKNFPHSISGKFTDDVSLPLYTCQVTLDISGSPIEFQWGSRKYPGYSLGALVLSLESVTHNPWMDIWLQEKFEMGLEPWIDWFHAQKANRADRFDKISFSWFTCRFSYHIEHKVYHQQNIWQICDT